MINLDSSGGSFQKDRGVPKKMFKKGISGFYPNKMTNNELMKQINPENIREIIGKRRRSYLGYILRRPNLPMLRGLEKRTSTKNMATVIRNDLNKRRLSNLEKAKNLAQNREN